MITGGLERSVFRAMLPTFVRQKMTMTSMVTTARDLGYSYRYTDMLRDIRQATGMVKHEAAVRATPSGQLVSKFNMTDIDLKHARRYRIYADATYRDLDTGSLRSQTVSMYSDEARSEEGWREEFEQGIRDAGCGIHLEVAEFDLKAVEHQAGWAY